jgi:hypothetical protein
MVTFNTLKLGFMADNDHGIMEEGGESGVRRRG